jgi:release factor glutamine methyltransferase
MAEPATVRRALAEAAERLAATSDTPRLDAELLMARAAGTTREALLLKGLDGDPPASFAALVDRRAAHEPVAYIVGRRAFWTIELAVTPAVLIPRPDSETLIEAALAECRTPPRTILDLGTGSGALLLAALGEWPAARGIGVDRSPAALAVARDNAQALGLADRADLRQGDWADGLDGPFNLILCNPPYVETGAVLPPDVAAYEPAGALFAGADGLDDYRRLMPEMRRLLAQDGLAILEIGHRQADAVQALAGRHGMSASTRADLSGLDRAILLRRTKD